MKDVVTKHPNAKGLLIGGFNIDSGSRVGCEEYEYYLSLKQLIQRYQIEQNIIFTEYLKNIPEVLSDLDIVVHASCTPEPFGLVIIEAMAAGKPVVATNAGGVPEIIQDGKNGLLVPLRDAATMADAINLLAGNPDMSKRIGASAIRRVDDKFTADRQAQEVQSLYSTLLGQSRTKYFLHQGPLQ
jgi:glycosyltransferase involved in cell wall biosynthesis